MVNERIIKVLRQVKKVGEEVAMNVPALNCGGCGVYAYYLGKRLLKMGLNVHAVGLGEYGEKIDFQRVKNLDFYRKEGYNIRNIEREFGDLFSHVALYLPGLNKWVDSSGVYDKFDDIKYFGCRTKPRLYMPIKELKYIIDSPVGWNSAFDRSNKSKIQRYIYKIK